MSFRCIRRGVGGAAAVSRWTRPVEESIPWKIVLIDDEKDILEVVSLDLVDAGYQTFTAGDGAAGMELIEAVSPQIVITDIRMPGMDGLEVLSRTKERDRNTQVIVVTAFGELDIATRALQLDASDFITKPVSPEGLHLAIKRAKERYSALQTVADYTRLLEQENARTAAELNRSVAFQRNLIACSMDGILGCDDSEVAVVCNQSLQKLTGLSREAVIGKMRLADFFEKGTYKSFKEALSGERFGGSGSLLSMETRMKNQEGEPVPVQVSASIFPGSGGPAGLVCYFRDLREIRRIEQEMADQADMLHQDKMMSLGRLAASVVHEINNPLSGILNYLRLMIRILNRGQLSGDQREKFSRYLALVEKETEKCARIVANLLTFSRKTEPAFEETDIRELFDRSIVLSRHKMELCHIRLDVKMDEVLPGIVADSHQLQQCLINLIFNAIDAMPEGGALTLRATYDEKQGRVTIGVRDTGRGIPPEDLSRIFDPFFTTKEEGSGVGLGLSTVFGIMERHGGRVEVDSKPGTGTEFRLILPLAAGRA